MWIGFIECEKCGYKYIKDASSVTVWFAADAIKQLVDIICPGCSEVRTGRPEYDDFIKLTSHPINIKPLSDKYTPLTQEMIDDWDIDREWINGISRLI